ncbi:MAG: hypothetical protein Q7S87_16080 [Agitococcus sp.]|nr:hypothetical protein [Agitococcus sp.]MDO9179077.1 hypothetical protein [Agitococcus sp.]
MATNAVAFWIEQQQQKVTTEAAGNLARLRGATTLAEVVRLANVHIPAEVRSFKSSLPELRNLNSAIDRKLDSIVKARLLLLSKTATILQASRDRSQLMQDCQILRGTYAQYYRFAERESALHLHRIQLREKGATTDSP